MLKRTIATMFVAALLCLVAFPATALAAAPSGQAIYIGGENVASGGYWTTDSEGNVTAYSGTDTPTDNYIHYNTATNTLTLHNATIKEEVPLNTSTYVAGAAIGVHNQNGAAELTITLEGTNTIEDVSAAIHVFASSTGAANLTITGNGSLSASSRSNPGIRVQSNTGNGTLAITGAKVTASSSSNGNGVQIRVGNGSNASLTVNGGSLTATGSGVSRGGIEFQFGSSESSYGTPTVTVSGNAIVRANGSAGGITSNSSTGVQTKADTDGTDGTGGIVFDGKNGTVYGKVELQENLEIGEGESLTIGDGASLNTGSHEVIVNGGTLTGGDKITGTVKYAPTITTESLPNGTVGTTYSQTLAATGSDTITWSLASGSLPEGLSINESTGEITGTPTAEGSSTFTVNAENSYGSDSREYTLAIAPEQTVSVTGVSLSEASLTLTEEETATLTATVEPANATNKGVTWSSNDETVATVDADGKVTAVGTGTATITVTTEDGNKTATCTVTVEHDPAGAWSSDADGHWHACAACGDKLSYAGHTRTVENEKKATCTEEGYTGDTVCSVCGYVIATGETVPAAGHEYGDGGHCAVCGGIDPGFSPKIVAGAYATWQKGSAKGLTFTSNAAYEDFREVRLDGETVAAKHYRVTKGSTIVTLKANYLETLKLGSHELEIVSSTGTAKTSFAVVEAHTSGVIVPTGDSILPMLGAVAAITLGVGAILAGRALSCEHHRQ